jgi:hypothetical protein
MKFDRSYIQFSQFFKNLPEQSEQNFAGRGGDLPLLRELE